MWGGSQRHPSCVPSLPASEGPYLTHPGSIWLIYFISPSNLCFCWAIHLPCGIDPNSFVIVFIKCPFTLLGRGVLCKGRWGCKGWKSHTPLLPLAKSPVLSISLPALRFFLCSPSSSPQLKITGDKQAQRPGGKGGVGWVMCAGQCVMAEWWLPGVICGKWSGVHLQPVPEELVPRQNTSVSRSQWEQAETARSSEEEKKGLGNKVGYLWFGKKRLFIPTQSKI